MSHNNGYTTVENDALLEFERACGELELPVIGHGFKAQRKARALAAYKRLIELSLFDALTDNEKAIALSVGGVFPPKPAKRKPLHKRRAKSYGPPRYSDEQPMDIPELPNGATHLCFSNSKVELVAPISMLGDFKTLRGGSIRFGRTRYNDEFIPIGDEPEAPSEPLAPDVVEMRKPAPPVGKRKVVFAAPVLPPPAKKPAPPKGKIAAKPAPEPKPAAPKAAKIVKAGNSARPGDMSSKTGLVWAAADAAKAKGKPVDRAAITAALAKQGVSAGTVQVQLCKWKKENV